MKPKDIHDKERCILGGEVLSDPGWGLFRPAAQDKATLLLSCCHSGLMLQHATPRAAC